MARKKKKISKNKSTNAKQNNMNVKNKNINNKSVKNKKASPSKGSAIPEGLKNTSATASISLEQAINDSSKKAKRKKKRKGMNFEAFFWILVLVLLIASVGFAAYFIFDDYYDDKSTPAQKAIEDINEDDYNYFAQLGSDIENIEKISVTSQGPIVYMIYTVPAGTPREAAVASVTSIFTTAKEEKAEVFEKYDFQITVVNSGEEAEGVNDYPIIGAINNNAALISWMDMSNTFIEPVEPEETTETTETTE